MLQILNFIHMNYIFIIVICILYSVINIFYNNLHLIKKINLYYRKIQHKIF